MNRYQAQERYEQKTLFFTDGRFTERLRVITVIESGTRFCTALCQRVNLDGSIHADDFNQPRERTFAHSHVTILEPEEIQ